MAKKFGDFPLRGGGGCPLNRKNPLSSIWRLPLAKMLHVVWELGNYDRIDLCDLDDNSKDNIRTVVGLIGNGIWGDGAHLVKGGRSHDAWGGWVNIMNSRAKSFKEGSHLFFTQSNCPFGYINVMHAFRLAVNTSFWGVFLVRGSDIIS